MHAFILLMGYEFDRVWLFSFLLSVQKQKNSSFFAAMKVGRAYSVRAVSTTY